MSEMSSHLIPIYFVDAFTTDENAAFTGNPAAVCFLDYDVRRDLYKSIVCSTCIKVPFIDTVRVLCTTSLQPLYHFHLVSINI